MIISNVASALGAGLLLLSFSCHFMKIKIIITTVIILTLASCDGNRTQEKAKSTHLNVQADEYRCLNENMFFIEII